MQPNEYPDDNDYSWAGQPTQPVELPTRPVGSLPPVNNVPVKVDAKNRAWRTFLQNIGVDVAVAVGPVLYSAVTADSEQWSEAYWTALGLSVGKTVALVVIAYIMRLKKKPVNATQ